MGEYGSRCCWISMQSVSKVTVSEEILLIYKHKLRTRLGILYSKTLGFKRWNENATKFIEPMLHFFLILLFEYKNWNTRYLFKNRSQIATVSVVKNAQHFTLETQNSKHHTTTDYQYLWREGGFVLNLILLFLTD